MTKSRLAASGLLALVFALGALVGGAATMLADRSRHGPDRFGERPAFTQYLKDELDLTADQEQKVTAVMDRHQPAMESIWGLVRPQFEAERETVRQEIRQLLLPEQLKKYETLVAHRDSLRRARGNKHGPR